MANDLKISLTASLNTGKSIGEINTAIGGIEKKVKALKLNIEINDKVLNTLNNFTKEFSKISAVAKDTGKVIQEMINPDGSKTKLTFFNGLKGEFSQISTAAKKSASNQVSSLEQVSKEFEKVTRQVEKFNAAQQKIGGSTSLSNNDGTVKRTINTDANNNVKNFRDTYDYSKDEKLIAQMEQFRLQSMQRRAQEERALNQAQQQAIQKNAEIERAEIAKTQSARQSYEQWWQQALANRSQQERKANQATINSLDEYKRKAEIQATGLLNNKNKILSPDQVTSLNNYLSAVRGLNAQTPQLASKMKSLGLDFKEISANAQQASFHSMSFGEAFKTAISKFSIWMGASTIFFQSLRFITDGIKFVDELNKSLTEISIVTGQSQASVAALGREYNKLAQEMGVTTTEIARATTEFYRQGLTQAEVMERTRVATQYAKISALDFQTSAQVLTATVNSMGVDIERAADVFSYLGDATATGADEIGLAFQKVGGSAGSLGINFEKVASWIAVISSKTRESAQTVGQSVKSILARIQNMKEKGFDEEDGTKVNQVAKALSAIDVALMDSNGQFRDFGQVMDEIGAKWDTLDSRQKAYISTTVAGTYQQNKFLNLMEGYSQSVDLYKNSLNSAGTATEKFGLYMQGNEAALNKLKATWEGLWMATFNSDVIKLVIGGLTGIASALKTIGNTFGSLPAVFAGVGVAILAFNGGLKSIMINGSLVIATMKGMVPGVIRLDAALAGATLRARLFGATSRGLTAVVGGLKTALVSTGTFLAGAIFPLAAFAAVGYAISKITESLAKQRQEEEQLKRQQESIITTYKKRKDEVSNMVAEYERLSTIRKETGKLSNTDEEKYVELQNQLSKILPQVKVGVTAKGDAIIQSSDAIREQIDLLEEQIELEKEQQRLEAPKKIEGNASKVDKLKEEQQYNKEVADQYKKDLANLQKEKASASEIAEVRRLEGEYRLKQKNTEAQIYALTSKNSSSIKTFFEGMKLDSTVTDKMSSMLSSIDFSGKDMGEIEGTIGSIVKAIGELNLAMQSGDATSIKNAKSSLNDLLTAYGNGKLDVNDFTVALQENTSTQDDNKKKVDETKKSFEDMVSTMSTKEIVNYSIENANAIDTEANATEANTASKYENMSATEMAVGMKQDDIDKTFEMIQVYSMLSTQENLSESQKYALATATQFLTNTYPALVEGHELNIEAMAKEAKSNNILIKAVEASANGQLTAQQAATVGTAVATKSRIDAIKAEMKGLQLLLSAYGELAEASTDAIMAKVNAGLLPADVALKVIGIKAGIEQRKKELADLQKSLNGIKLPNVNLKTPKSGGSGSGSGSGSDKPTADEVRQGKIDSTIQKYDEQLKTQDQLLQQSKALQERYKEGSKEWIAESNKQIAILEKKRSITNNEINDLKKLLKTEKLSKEQKAEVNAQIQELTTSQLEYLNAIADTDHAIQQEAINKKIAETEKLYNDQIDALQKKLDLMDEEEKKQDRLNELKQIEADIAKAKSDKRYEYIDKDGNVQLTYDKAKVAELEQEKKDKQAEWKKEDDRTAIENQIAEAEANRDKAIASLEKLQETYLYKAYKDTADLKKIMAQFTKDLASTFKNGTVKVPKHHDGGIVGQSTGGSRLASLVNDLFNVKPNEQIVKALKGEIMVPQANIPNFLANISNLAGQLLSNQPAQTVNQGTTIILQNPVIQANNPLELLQGLQSITRKK